jgi:hypothetical protein
MRINPKINLRAWVRENIAPWDKEHSSYLLKHRAEDAIGSYVSNGEMRGAMMDAGYLPAEIHGPNAFYRAGTRKDLERHFALDTLFLLEGLQMWAYRIRRQLYLRNREEA